MKFAHKILIAIIVISISATLPGCRGKPKKEVEISPLKGRIAFDKLIPVGESGNIMAPYLTTDKEGRLYIAYMHQYDSLHRVFYVYFDEKKNEFSHAIQLSQKEGMKPTGVTIDALGGTLFAIWANEDITGRRLKFRKSADGGRNFTMEKKFSASRDPVRWAVAGTPSDPLAFYTHSSDEGSGLVLNKGFDPEREFNLLKPGNYVRGVKAVTDEKGDIYVICLLRKPSSGGGGFKMLHSHDGGEDFAPYRLFPDEYISFHQNAYDFDVTTSDSKTTVHLIWTERSRSGVRLMYSHNTTGSFAEWTAPEEMVSTSRVEDWLCSQPFIATDGGRRIVIVYAYQTDEDEKRYFMAYRFSEDEGETFFDEAMVTDGISSPEVITGGISLAGTVHIAWDDEDPEKLGARQIFYVSGRVR